MYLLVLFLIFPFYLSFNLAMPQLHNWRAHHQELQQRHLAIRLARWIWRKVHHDNNTSSFSLSLFGFGTSTFHFLILLGFQFWHIFILFRFSIFGILFFFFLFGFLMPHKCLKKCLNWTLDWVCGTQLLMHVQCYLHVNCDINISSLEI